MESCDPESSSYEGDEYVEDVAQISHKGHDQHGKGVGLGHVQPQFLILFVEVFFCFLLVAKYLDHLFAVDHLLDVAVKGSQGCLLLHEVAAGLACYGLCHEQRKKRECNCHQREPQAQVKHGAEHSRHAYYGAEKLGQGLGQHLS